MSKPFTVRNVTKYVATTAVHSYVAQHVETAIIDHTSFEEDDFVVKTSSHVVGWMVADRFRPTTDRLVDGVADRIVAFREKRQAKKSEKSETE
jgi:hypothetical protein